MLFQFLAVNSQIFKYNEFAKYSGMPTIGLIVDGGDFNRLEYVIDNCLRKVKTTERKILRYESFRTGTFAERVYYSVIKKLNPLEFKYDKFEKLCFLEHCERQLRHMKDNYPYSLLPADFNHGLNE